MNLKELSRVMTASWRLESPYDTHPQELINCAEFKVCTPGSFREPKTDTLKDRIALDILDMFCVFFYVSCETCKQRHVINH